MDNFEEPTTGEDPILAVEEERRKKQEMYKAFKDNDQKTYEIWKANPTKQNLGKVITSLSGIIYKEVGRASGTLPTVALGAEAKKWAFRAIQTYDPSKGTLLSTHVQNYLPKIRRLNYKYQNAVRLPENMQLKYHDYNHAITSLTDELNREPTDEELAKKLGWSKPQTVKFKNSLYSDLIESSSDRPSEFVKFNENAILMEHLMNSLDSQEKFILENSKVMSSTDLAKKLGVNLNRFNYLKSKLIEKIKNLKQTSGMY